jgi:Nitrile hydratase, alpha chain
VTAVAAQTNWQQQWGQIVAKAWGDPAFKSRLISDPAAVLKEQGVSVPAGVQFKVVESTDKLVYLPLPPAPSSEELSEEELANVAGGIVRTCFICGCPPYP